MKKNTTAGRTNARAAQRIWSTLSREAIARLREIAALHGFSVSSGDLIYLNNGWYVTHTGLIGLARRKRCNGIHVEAVDSLCDSSASRFVLKATVFPSEGSSGFVGYGDADPSNVSFLVHGAEMRVAETRAVNRALRKAYGIGICSVEEIGSVRRTATPSIIRSRRSCLRNRRTGMAVARFAIDSAKSSASISSIPTGQGLCHRLLRREGSSRCYPRPGGKLRRAPGRLGRERPQCPALPAQQLSRRRKKVPHETPDHRTTRSRSVCR